MLVQAAIVVKTVAPKEAEELCGLYDAWKQAQKMEEAAAQGKAAAETALYTRMSQLHLTQVQIGPEIQVMFGSEANHLTETLLVYPARATIVRQPDGAVAQPGEHAQQPSARPAGPA